MCFDSPVKLFRVATNHLFSIGEEYTLTFAVQFLLGTVGKRGPVCKNLSTTRAVNDVAAKNPI